jgi:hypothetical protein
MVNTIYLRHQAERLIALSRATIDLGIAARLRGLAAEFLATADQSEEHANLSSLSPLRRAQSQAVDRE